MDLKQLVTDDDAVSPVIGVILMVAITVILAAVIGAFVLNIGGNQESAPQAQWDWADNPNPTGDGDVTLTHNGGETITSPGQITAGGDLASDYTLTGDSWDAGTSVTFDGSTPPAPSNPSGTGTITLTWTSSSGDSSQIIAEHDYDLS